MCICMVDLLRQDIYGGDEITSVETRLEGYNEDIAPYMGHRHTFGGSVALQLFSTRRNFPCGAEFSFV